MQIQSFNAELAMANLMFLRLFNNIKITRTNTDNTKSEIKVNCQFGQRSRIYKNWQNSEKRATMKLPMLIINRTGFTRNGERLNDMHNEVKYEITSKYRKYELLTPIPIDISYDVTIMSKYTCDIDQIASNFMVFFNPDVYVTCIHPKYEGIKLNNQVIMNDSVTEEHPDELDGSTDDFTTTTFQFTFKTYLFGGQQQFKKVPKYILSSYLSTGISSYVYELTETDKENISNFISCNLSTTLTCEAKTSISTYVENPDGETIYEDITPIIKNIDIGFYAVPEQSADFTEYMDYVDQLDPNWMYVDKLIWQVDEYSKYEFPNNGYLTRGN